MDKPITTRLPEDFVLQLKEISEKEHLDMSAVIRRLLAKSIKEWKIKYALEKYKEGEFSFGEIAEFANVSVWDVPKLLKEHKIPLNYDIEEFHKDLEAIKKWK
ncbi:UPF0175 family protein [Candidatus Pacearchaeota archaeon]|nr:UPF0175 family protein [Candidatus Pacearchaeota archaeon]